jgi:hypothetical protein
VDVFYPARAAVICELAADLMGGRAPRSAPERIEAVEQMTRVAAAARPDFWSVAGVAELQVLKALSRHSLQQDLPGILAEFRDLKERVPAPHNWDSVHTEAKLVLPLYRGLKRLPAAEREAVDTLLEALGEFAQAAD